MHARSPCPHGRVNPFSRKDATAKASNANAAPSPKGEEAAFVFEACNQREKEAACSGASVIVGVALCVRGRCGAVQAAAIRFEAGLQLRRGGRAAPFDVASQFVLSDGASAALVASA